MLFFAATCASFCEVREQRAAELNNRELAHDQTRAALESLAAAVKRLSDPAARVAKELVVRMTAATSVGHRVPLNFENQ